MFTKMRGLEEEKKFYEWEERVGGRSGISFAHFKCDIVWRLESSKMRGRENRFFTPFIYQYNYILVCLLKACVYMLLNYTHAFKRHISTWLY